MKGLLIKDLYMIKSYCRMHLILLLGFGFLAFMDKGNGFFLLYPAVMAGSIPMTLLAYETQFGWESYCQALPVTRRQQVTVKYLINLLAVGITVLLDLALLLILGNPLAPTLEQLGMVLLTGTASGCLLLPPIFKFGVEKGRIAYYAVIGGMCALSFQADLSGGVALPPLLPWLLAPVILLMSWALSCKLYQNREL